MTDNINNAPVAATEQATVLDIMSLIRQQCHRVYASAIDREDIDTKYMAEIEAAIRSLATPADAGAGPATKAQLTDDFPPLPESFGTMENVDAEGYTIGWVQGYTADQVRMYAIDYARLSKPGAPVEAWEYSIIQYSALDEEVEVGPCLAYSKKEAFGKECVKQKRVFVSQPPAPVTAEPADRDAIRDEALEYRTCCDYPGCLTCNGFGGFYRKTQPAASLPATSSGAKEGGAA